MNKQVEARREKIRSYLETQDCTPLVFKNPHRNKEKAPELKYDGNLESFVKSILLLSDNYASYNSITGVMETRCGSKRSSLDIWRHAIYVDPRITIYDIMETLYKMHRDLVWNYCCNVRRLVFRLNQFYYYNDDEHVLAREYMIRFSTWNKLK